MVVEEQPIFILHLNMPAVAAEVATLVVAVEVAMEAVAVAAVTAEHLQIANHSMVQRLSHLQMDMHFNQDITEMDILK